MPIQQGYLTTFYLSIFDLDQILRECISRKLRIIDRADDFHHQTRDHAAHDESNQETNGHERKDGRPPAGVNCT